MCCLLFMQVGVLGFIGVIVRLLVVEGVCKAALGLAVNPIARPRLDRVETQLAVSNIYYSIPTPDIFRKKIALIHGVPFMIIKIQT